MKIKLDTQKWARKGLTQSKVNGNFTGFRAGAGVLSHVHQRTPAGEGRG